MPTSPRKICCETGCNRKTKSPRSPRCADHTRIRENKMKRRWQQEQRALQRVQKGLADKYTCQECGQPHNRFIGSLYCDECAANVERNRQRRKNREVRRREAVMNLAVLAGKELQKLGTMSIEDFGAEEMVRLRKIGGMLAQATLADPKKGRAA